ncbi:MAG: hypothetical protein A2901_03705 [Elusimicrobia bacterium RIFCSPLOWO2_01_FULL_54_10]|nr:MAG: hypothetical protein A2901_03705 [Elusimicrobia bacterium RIFCSPLOWO2_01_FULL_54_10]
MTADFSIDSKTFIEFFGLAGVQKYYDKLLKRKRWICRQKHIRLIEVYPCDLFPKNRLSEILKV